MAKTVRINDLAKTIVAELSQYTGGVIEGMNGAVLEVVKGTAKELRKTPTPKRFGAYRKSWSYTKNRVRKGNFGYTVYSRGPHYRKTHLLEKGHATRSGGRTRAYPHIKPAEQRAIKSYQKKIEKVIEG